MFSLSRLGPKWFCGRQNAPTDVPPAHTLPTLPPLSYPSVGSSVLEKFFDQKFLYAFFVGTEAKGVEIRRGTLPLPSRRREGKVQLSGGESLFLLIF